MADTTGGGMDDGLAGLLEAHARLMAARAEYLDAVAGYEAAMLAAGEAAGAGALPLPAKPAPAGVIRPAVVAVLRVRPVGLPLAELAAAVAGRVRSASKDPVHVARTVIGQMVRDGTLVRDGDVIRLPESPT